MTESALLEILFAESPDFERLIREIQESQTQLVDIKPRVMVCGLLKAGKSSLLNALTDNLEQEYFVTNAARATTSVSDLTVNGITYVDTPGLDANKADDDEAWRGLASADLFVFVHNLRVAAIDTEEVKFLKELLRRRPDAPKHMVVALTNAESAEEGKEERLGELSNSLKTVLGLCPSPVLTSFTRYQKGTLQNKPKLVEQSGIPELHSALKKLLKKGHWLKARTTHAETKRVQLRELIAHAINYRQNTLADFREKQKLQHVRLREDLVGLVENTRERIARYETI